MSGWLARLVRILLPVILAGSPYTSHAAEDSMRIGPREIREIWFVDFEFSAPPGERPTPVCLVARELNSGRELRLWEDELKELKAPPYPIGPDSLFVAYYDSA